VSHVRNALLPGMFPNQILPAGLPAWRGAGEDVDPGFVILFVIAALARLSVPDCQADCGGTTCLTSIWRT
jgi:hypothetical protein